MAETTKIVAEPGEKTLILTRLFDGPRHLVYEASTRPELLKRWWGPFGSELIVCEIDLRVGGAWRYVLRFPDGKVTPSFSGVYREIVPNERIVQTFIFEPYPEAPALETVTFVEQGAQTLLTIHVLHTTVESRDGHLQSGMERGVQDTHRRLDELMRTLAHTA